MFKILLTVLYLSLIIPGINALAQGLSARGSRPFTETAVTSPSNALTLMDCYHLALEQSETIKISKEVIREEEGKFMQVLSGILPKVSFESTDMRQDGSGGSNFTLREIPERKFTFSQPLFSGFKDFAALAASKAEKRQRQQEEIRAEQLLFIDVSDAFYFFMSYQQDLEALESTRAALEGRVDELNKRERLGRSRPSEVASAEARLRKVEADLESVKSGQEVSRQLMEFLTGRAIDTLVENSLEASASNNMEDYLGKADNRPDVRASKEALTAAKKNIAVARAGFFPTVSADGDYYTKRVGNAADVTWDATLKVSVPIFQGGENVGKVKEANSLARQAELTFYKTRRGSLLEIKNNFTRWQSSLRKVDALQKAFEAARKSYDLQKEDYTRNLVNNLEVLQSLQDLQDSRRDLIAAKNEFKRLYSNLLVSTGEIAP